MASDSPAKVAELLGNQIGRYRVGRNLSREQLAKIAFVPKDRIEQMERSMPFDKLSRPELERLAMALGFDSLDAFSDRIGIRRHLLPEPTTPPPAGWLLPGSCSCGSPPIPTSRSASRSRPY